ncbi:hypothetical protein CDEF62S_01041 [Castellaniella defragrans]
MTISVPLPTRLLSLTGAVALALAAGAALAANPVDRVSNPNGLKYSNVEMKVPDYDVPFKRKGDEAVQKVRQIVPGTPAARVAALIGEPLSKDGGRDGEEWNYNIRLVMPVSKNSLVCQYKVVFAADQQVRDTVWRRRQCQQIAAER